MPHYHLEGLENEWTLIRETPSSQKFRVTNGEGHHFAVDVHFTPSKLLTVNVCFVGKTISKSILGPVLDDVSKIALRRADYAIVDYTVCCCDRIDDGNYAVDAKTREIYKDTL